MLNYVWVGLLFLGIATALVYDISDKTSDRFRNGTQIPIEVVFKEEQDPDKKSVNAEILVSASALKKFYNTDAEDLVIPAKIYNSQNSASAVTFLIPDNAPPIWNEIGEMYGKENDLGGKIIFHGDAGDSIRTAGLLLEEVSFVKLKGITNELISYAGTAVEIALGLIGVMALWLGIMKIAEAAGLISVIARALKPVTKKLFPDVPSDHPAIGSMVMNISANMLGLGNAATPFGLKAMEELDKLNPDKGTATNSMITFLAINTAGLTLIPASAIAVRAASGSSDPALIIGTTIFGSLCATTAGVTTAKLIETFQRKDDNSGLASKLKKVSFVLLAIIAAIIIITFIARTLGGSINPDTLRSIIETISILAIPVLIVSFVIYGIVKKVKVYEQFIEGAKEGFNIAVRIIPYLVAILIAIGIFRAGGAMDWLVFILSPVTNLIGMPAEALPMALMRPLSGSGSLGIMAEIFTVHGPDSFIGLLVSTFYGSTETTFYVLAVYFGAVNIKNTRHALPVGLIADAAGLLAALFIVRLLFG